MLFWRPEVFCSQSSSAPAARTLLQQQQHSTNQQHFLAAGTAPGCFRQHVTRNALVRLCCKAPTGRHGLSIFACLAPRPCRLRCRRCRAGSTCGSLLQASASFQARARRRRSGEAVGAAAAVCSVGLWPQLQHTPLPLPQRSTKGRTATSTVVPEPSFNVPLGLLAISGLSAYEGVTPLALLAGALGVLLTVQATRVK